jgi:hypothetical protein
VGSFIEEYNNKVGIEMLANEIAFSPPKVSIVQLHESRGEFVHIGTFEHP